MWWGPLSLAIRNRSCEGRIAAEDTLGDRPPSVKMNGQRAVTFGRHSRSFSLSPMRKTSRKASKGGAY